MTLSPRLKDSLLGEANAAVKKKLTVIMNALLSVKILNPNAKQLLHGKLEKFLCRVRSICKLCSVLERQPKVQCPPEQRELNFESNSYTARQPLFL